MCKLCEMNREVEPEDGEKYMQGEIVPLIPGTELDPFTDFAFIMNGNVLCLCVDNEHARINLEWKIEFCPKCSSMLFETKP